MGLSDRERVYDDLRRWKDESNKYGSSRSAAKKTKGKRVEGKEEGEKWKGGGFRLARIGSVIA